MGIEIAGNPNPPPQFAISGQQGGNGANAAETNRAEGNGAISEIIANALAGGRTEGSITALFGGAGRAGFIALMNSNPELAEGEDLMKIMNVLRRLVAAMEQMGGTDGTDGTDESPVGATGGAEDPFASLSGTALNDKIIEIATRFAMGLTGDESLAQSYGLSTPVQVDDVVKLIQDTVAEGGNDALKEFDKQATKMEKTNSVIDRLLEFAVGDKGLDPGSATYDADVAALRREIAEKLSEHLKLHPDDLDHMDGKLGGASSGSAAAKFLKTLDVETPSGNKGILSISAGDLASTRVGSSMDAMVKLLVMLLMMNLENYSRNRELAVNAADTKYDLGMLKAANTRDTSDKQFNLDMSKVDQMKTELVFMYINIGTSLLSGGLAILCPAAGVIVNTLTQSTSNLVKQYFSIDYATEQAELEKLVGYSRSDGEEIDASKERADASFQLFLKDMDKAMEMVSAMLQQVTELIQMVNQLEQKAGGMGA